MAKNEDLYDFEPNLKNLKSNFWQHYSYNKRMINGLFLEVDFNDTHFNVGDDVIYIHPYTPIKKTEKFINSLPKNVGVISKVRDRGIFVKYNDGSPNAKLTSKQDLVKYRKSIIDTL